MSTDIGVWVGACLTLGVYSYLVKGNNVFFEFTMSTFVAFSAAHLFISGIKSVNEIAVQPLLQKGQFIYVIPLVLGVLLYARLAPKSISWLGRLPVAILVSIAAAAQLCGAVQAEFVNQLIATARLDMKNPSDMVFLIGVVTVCAYFLHLKSTASSAPTRFAGRIGRCFMMVGFGASIGSTVMTRFSALIERFQFLFGEWIKLIK